MALKPSVDVLLPPVWPLACARRVKFLNSSIEVRVRPWAQEKNSSTGVTILHVDTFRKHVKFLLSVSPNKIVRSGPPSSQVLPVPGVLDIDGGVLGRCVKSFALHTRIQLLVLCPPSLHQPAKSLLEVLYLVSLPVIIVSIWVSM